MYPEIKQKWVEALRSGEYEQGVGYLCRSGKFCCLGVLTDLYIKAEGGEWTPRENRGAAPCAEGIYALGSEAWDLPPVVADWAGADSLGLEIAPVEFVNDSGDHQDATSLITLNDIAHWNFNQIADVIEERL